MKERFGHQFAVIQQEQSLIIERPGSQRLVKFDALQSVFHQSRSQFPCHKWAASSEGFQAAVQDRMPAPSEYPLASPLVEWRGHNAIIHYDILGLTYWMLTRLEEVGREDLDEYQRFPATSSHAYKHEYLERPIVDEWLIILGQVIERVWPGIQLKKHKFSIKVSHDVDRPSRYGFRPLKSLFRAMAGDVLKYQNFKGAMIAPWVRMTTKNKLHAADPFNTFEWLMDVSEANNLTSAFYFICGRTHPTKDADYEPEHAAIRHLMRRIHERGHEIGLHPSFNTFQSPDLLREEADCLKRICAHEGIEQSEWGGRMHYLRWEQPTTLRAWADSRMSYDSTLGYADRPGFRCGTCHEYPAFDPVSQEQLELKIRPLVVMEASVLSCKYLGMGRNEALERFELLKGRCRYVGGSFTLLWHNSELLSSESLHDYNSVLRSS